MNWKNLKLGAKFTIGFGIVLLLTVIVGNFGRKGLSDVKTRVEKADDVNRLVKYVLQTAAAQKEYLITKDEAALTYTSGVIKQIYEQAEITKEKFDDQYNKDQTDEIFQKTKILENTFNDYLTTEKEKDELMAQMRASAAEVIGEAEAINEDLQKQLRDALVSRNAGNGFVLDKVTKATEAQKIIQYFIDVRKNEKEVIISGEDQFVTKHQNGLSNTQNTADALVSSLKVQRNIEQGNRLKAALLEYEKKYEQYIAKQNEQYKKMELLNTNTTQALDVAEAARKDQKQKMENEISSANRANIDICPVGTCFRYFYSSSYLKSNIGTAD